MSDFEQRFEKYSREHMSTECNWLSEQIRDRQSFIYDLNTAIDQIERDTCKYGSSSQALRKQYFEQVLAEQKHLLKFYCDCYELLLASIRNRMLPSEEYYF